MNIRDRIFAITREKRKIDLHNLTEKTFAAFYDTPWVAKANSNGKRVYEISLISDNDFEDGKVDTSDIFNNKPHMVLANDGVAIGKEAVFSNRYTARDYWHKAKLIESIASIRTIGRITDITTKDKKVVYNLISEI